MDNEKIAVILHDFQFGKVSLDQAIHKINDLVCEPVQGFAMLDHQRQDRTGFPEVILAQGKTPDQVAQIFTHLQGHGSVVMATRVSVEMYESIREQLPEATYHPLSRILYCEQGTTRRKKPGVLVMSAGTSDIPVAEEAALTAELMGNEVERIYDVGVAGLHRLLSQIEKIKEAHVIIVAAGMEGALPSVVGGLISVPLIALPTSVGYGASFQGLAALLGMLNSCANGVAVVNIDNGYGAGCIASRINNLAVVQ